MKDEKFSSDDDDYFLKPKKNIVKDKEILNKKNESLKSNKLNEFNDYSEREIKPINNLKKETKKKKEEKEEEKKKSEEDVEKGDNKNESKKIRIEKEETKDNSEEIGKKREITKSTEFSNFNEIYSFLKIDKNNYFSEMKNKDYNEIKDIISSFKEKKGKDSNVQLINEILKKFLEGISPNCDNEATAISKNFSKELNKIKKLTKNIIEEYIDYFFSLRYDLLYSTNFLLSKKTLKYLGYILSYVFSKLHKFFINSGSQLNHLIKKTIEKKIDVLIDYYNYINTQKVNDNNNKKTYFWKKNRNKYLIPPELNFLINRFIKIKTIELEFDFQGEEINDVDFKLISISLLNLKYVFINLSHIKINLINHKLQYGIYNGYYKDLVKDLFIKRNMIKKNIINNPELIYDKKWDFKHLFNLQEYRIIEKNKKLNEFNKKNLVYDDYNLLYVNNTKKEINEIQMLNSTIEKPRNSLKLENKNNIFNVEKNNLKNIGDEKETNNKKKKDNKINKIIKGKNNYIEIIKKNAKILDLIAIIICSLGRLNKINNLDLIMNDSYNYEFLTHLVNTYNLDTDLIYNDFHILDIIYNKIKDLKILNIEINALDSLTFNKVLNFIYKNESLNSIYLSFFSSDASYFRRALLKLYNQIIGNAEKIIKYKNIENKILEDFLIYFIQNLSVLFEILKKSKNIQCLGLNFDLPFIIRIKQSYALPILKFILNILFLIDNYKCKIKKLTILSPLLVVGNKIFPGLNDIIYNISINENNKILNELNIQFQFNQIIYIKNLISTRLIKLNIGDLDLMTFSSLVKHLISYKFCISSNLKNLGIGLNKTITFFNTELKLNLRNLFYIKIANLLELNIYTNLILNEKDYKYLLNILNDNWISSYVITFNSLSNIILEKYNSSRNNIKFFISHKLEKKIFDENENNKNKINNKDINHDYIFWCLKYLFNKKYCNSSSNFVSKKNCINSIIKYLYFSKKIKIKHSLEEEEEEIGEEIINKNKDIKNK